jgi:hypothetical protein
MQSEFTKGGSLMQSDLEISKTLKEQIYQKPIGLSQEVFPVKIFPSLAKVLGWQEKGQGFGMSMPALLASYDPNSQSWKMLGPSLFEDLTPFLGRLPKSGMMRNGKMYGPQIWVRPTKGNGSGLWPTPAANDAKNSLTPSQMGRGTLTARLVEMMYPTPVASGKLCGGSGDFQKLQKMKEEGLLTEEKRRSMSAGNGGKLNP